MLLGTAEQEGIIVGDVNGMSGWNGQPHKKVFQYMDILVFVHAWRLKNPKIKRPFFFQQDTKCTQGLICTGFLRL